jgi:AraC family transcriptional regulator
MRRDRSRPLLVALWTCVACLLAAPLTSSQTLDISVQQIEPFAYVCMPVRGAFSQFQEAMGRLMMEMQSQNTAPTGPLIAITYSDPDRVATKDLEWEVGFSVSPRQTVQPPLALKSWDHAQVATCLHKGPYEDIGETIIKMVEWISAHGYAPDGPVLERYLDMNPAEMSPNDLKTEIWIPCKKK